MRINEKLKANGYNSKTHEFKGWKIQEKRALKYVHPSIIADLQEQIAKRDNLWSLTTTFMKININ